jgi:pimeloyl-ACP methyl ester carboxylesterase
MPVRCERIVEHARLGIRRDGALLVRPDGFVAWRARRAGDGASLARAMQQILGRTPALADQIASLRCDVLLLGGTRSARELRRSLDAAARRLPSAKLERFAGLGHTAAADDGRPQVVAERLRAFFQGA